MALPLSDAKPQASLVKAIVVVLGSRPIPGVRLALRGFDFSSIERVMISGLVQYTQSHQNYGGRVTFGYFIGR